MSEEWDPSVYKNTYHEDLMHRIEEKIKKHETHEITKPTDEDTGEPRSAKVIDLASLLKQSIDSSSPRRSGAHRRPKAGTKPQLRVVESRGHRQPAKRKRA